MNEEYVVYAVNFQPDPVVQGSMQSFNSDQEARKYIQENKQRLFGECVFLIKRIQGQDHGKLVETFQKS